ncbi:hypothetical protein GGR54DRAFT_615784 [Hypoxylon sp. NC1633]|nr:hypothetical protein GGR54DRAFT_615784 [Hypoxylon sp. NC1633]
MTTTTFFAALLGAASLVSAAPRPATAFIRPEAGVSNGFKLVANVIGAPKALSVPVQGAFLGGAHVGAGLSIAALNLTSPSPIFYQNGTAEAIADGTSNILTDGGTPPFPEGLRVLLNATAPSNPVEAQINAGIGTPGVTITKPVAGPGILKYESASFIACDETLAYYGPSWHFAIVKAFEGTAAVVPDNCVLIELVPQCATLPDLPEGSLSSHEYANEVACYEQL